jgi:hypothetical protein
MVPGHWPAVAIAGLFVLGGLALASGGYPPREHSAPFLPSARPGDSADCALEVPASGVQGELTLDGGPLLASSIAGVPLTYTYSLSYDEWSSPGGTLLGSGCLAAVGNTTTAANGSFSFHPTVPSEVCTTDCLQYLAAYAPARVALTDGPPAGYAVSVTGWSTPIVVALVYEIASVTINPAGPTVTTSAGAPTTFSALVWMQNGSLSDVEATFFWIVNGTGWRIDGSALSRTMNATGIAGAAVASVTVIASAMVGSDQAGQARATVDAVAVSTEIVTGQTNRTAMDEGQAMEIQLTAFGAPGYPYTAFIEPGLDLAPRQAPCVTGPASAGMVEVNCATSIVYTAAGIAQPTANVTNGFSAATWRFPNVAVSPLPELELLPAAPIGYALHAIPITVTAANDSGTQPYVQSCLLTSAALTLCQESPGPSWSFVPVFARPGNYSATASAVDAEGINASVLLTIQVADPLSVAPVVGASSNATIGVPARFNATITGGFFPLRYWWNATGSAGPVLSGELTADGTVSVTVSPPVANTMTVSLTVADRLGSVASAELQLPVGPVPAARVAAVTGPPLGSVTVGEPVQLAWEAFTSSGAPDTAFDVGVTLTLGSRAGPPAAWVNASGVGSIAPSANGSFDLPASSWVEGVLTVNVTVATATEVTVGLSGSGLPGAIAPMNVTFQPDRAHVRLLSPRVADAGARANATFYRIEDPFGNAVPGAVLSIVLSFGTDRETDTAVAVAMPSGGSGVWVNYSAPTDGAGAVTVFDAAGATVLGPLAVPAAPAPPPRMTAVEALIAAVPIGTAGAAAFAVVRRRRRARGGDSEEELRRLAEGRARTVELIGEAGAIDLAGLEAEWGGAPPPALADWLASLVADGTVRATIGEDGRPRFCLAGGPADGPKVTVDPEVLDRMLRRREEALDERPAAADDEAPA